MKKFLKILLTVFLVIISLTILSNYVDGQTVGTLFLILTFIFFMYVYNLMSRGKIEKELIKSANYKKDKVSKMSMSELSNRLKLFKLDKETDYTSLSSEKVKPTLIKIQKSAGNSLQQFMDGFNQGSGKPKRTYGAKDVLNFIGSSPEGIVCINCGLKMTKAFGLWNSSLQCRNAGRRCVPYERPKV
jgi:hypothetical protein